MSEHTNFYQTALDIPMEKRTPFEKWKASDPANTWVPWWLSDRIMKSMPEVCDMNISKNSKKPSTKRLKPV